VAGGGDGACARLHRRTPAGTPLRFGTLSWGVGQGWGQPPAEFLASVAAAAPVWGCCDLAVAAGLTLDSLPEPEAVLAASGGTPVLFEAAGDGGNRPWLLAYDQCGTPRQSVLRRRQLAQRFSDEEGFRLVAGAVARSAGVIDFEGASLRLVLFICGENNSLDPYGPRSVLKGAADGPTGADGLREVLGGPWVLLNPAHAGYFPHALPTGFGKVGVVKMGDDREAGPTLRWLAERTKGYRDGTKAPVAVVHVNNFDPGHPQTEGYAAVSFGDTEARVVLTAGPAAGEVAVLDGGARPWRACVFEVATGPGADDTTN
jgi:hypothetical protein